MSTTELMGSRRTIGQLRQCLGAVRARYGDGAVVRRVANNVTRLGSDAIDPEWPQTATSRTPGDQHQVVVIPDTLDNASLWQGADDEGAGAYQRDQQ